MKASGGPAVFLSVAITCSLRDPAVAAGKKEGVGRGLDKLFPLYFVQADPQRWASCDGGRQRVLLEASSCEPAAPGSFPCDQCPRVCCSTTDLRSHLEAYERTAARTTSDKA